MSEKYCVTKAWTSDTKAWENMITYLLLIGALVRHGATCPRFLGGARAL
jgi:hypothetical protein